MTDTARPLAMLAGEASPDQTYSQLESCGLRVETSVLTGIDPHGLHKYDLLILEVDSTRSAAAQALCRRWRIELGDQHIPILWLIPQSEIAQLSPAALTAGADSCLPQPLDRNILSATIQALLRVRHLASRLYDRGADVVRLNQHLQQLHRRWDDEADLARRLHRRLLSQPPSDLLSARFAVAYHPHRSNGGDFHDVTRLDEEHVGILIGDTMTRTSTIGGMLGVYLRQVLEPKEIIEGRYRLRLPSEALSRLNMEIQGLGPTDPPLISALYLQLNCRNGDLLFARAGHPAPLIIPVEEPVDWMYSLGPLLGVYDAEYIDQFRTLKAGEKILLYTDGLQSAEGERVETLREILRNAAERHRRLPVAEFVDRLAREAFERSRQPQDLTIIGIEMVA